MFFLETATAAPIIEITDRTAKKTWRGFRFFRVVLLACLGCIYSCTYYNFAFHVRSYVWFTCIVESSVLQMYKQSQQLSEVPSIPPASICASWTSDLQHCASCQSFPLPAYSLANFNADGWSVRKGKSGRTDADDFITSWLCRFRFICGWH